MGHPARAKKKKKTEIHACKLVLFDTYEASTLKELL